jgi:hypothetical protein
MEFLKKPAKYALFDHKTKQDIMKELETQPALKQSTILQSTCSQNGQISTLIRYYEIPTSRKVNSGRPLTGLLDCYTETGTGHEA